MKRSEITVGMAVRTTRDWSETDNVPAGTVAKVGKVEPPDYNGSWDVQLVSDDFEYGDAWVWSEILQPVLDPSKVKAGDTVTAEVPAHDSFGFHREAYTLTGKVYVGDTAGSLWVGPVQISGRVTLTDHQPAPEPEPEWKPGTVAMLDLTDDDLVPRVYRTSIGTWHSIDDLRSWLDDDVSYVREMVVIDPAAVDVDALARHNGLRTEPLRGVLRDLGIEVQS